MRGKWAVAAAVVLALVVVGGVGGLTMRAFAGTSHTKVVTKTVTKLCVNCLAPLEKGSELGGWLVPQDYFCRDCGYKGYVYLEDRRSEDAARTTGSEETAAGPRRS